MVSAGAGTEEPGSRKGTAPGAKREGKGVSGRLYRTLRTLKSPPAASAAAQTRLARMRRSAEVLFFLRMAASPFRPLDTLIQI